MGYLLTIACYIFSFSSSFAIFCQFIAHDPVRIILFFLGSFFWLVSILISSLIWFGLSAFINNSFIVSIGLCVAIQELSRVAYFVLLKKAQNGLNKITRQGHISVAPGVSDLHNSRHMLALVCGLGMGVISALFFTMNAFAAFSGPGTIGMPEALLKNTVDVNRAGKYLPAFYSLSALLLTLFHVCWTIMVWDSCHKFGRLPSAYVPGAAALVSHLFVAFLVSLCGLNTFMFIYTFYSTLNTKGFYILVLSMQILILIICIAYCNVIMGGTMTQFVNSISNSLIDAVTLKCVREQCTRQRQPTTVTQEEPLTERNAAPNTVST